MRAKRYKRYEKEWRNEARDHDFKADWHWTKSKKYEDEDWRKAKHYKNKARKHTDSARKCRWKATEYHKAADHDERKSKQFDVLALILLKL
jgi:hypothetical protein